MSEDLIHEIKKERKYLKKHPKIALDIIETEEINLLRSVCGDCPDFYKEDCPRDPMLCGRNAL